eukprot:2268929-Pyramimonas_sp.AAC.1
MTPGGDKPYSVSWMLASTGSLFVAGLLNWLSNDHPRMPAEFWHVVLSRAVVLTIGVFFTTMVFKWRKR